MTFQETIKIMVEEIRRLTQKLIEEADFDKSYIGVVTEVTSEPNKNIIQYEVLINGKHRTVSSRIEFTEGSYVLVLVPRNNWDNARIVPLDMPKQSLDDRYPVNSFYISSENISPSEIFGEGEWTVQEMEMVSETGQSYMFYLWKRVA